MNTTNAGTPNNCNGDSDDNLDFNDPELKNLLDNPTTFKLSRLRDTIQHKGFDNNTGDSWIYPNNLPCRSYQMNITQTALYRNTLVALPTGLGKTFIAAVVMYNIYRWYPCGKVIFMAPTRPLVNQQIEACQNIMPFPKGDIAQLTGKLSKTNRQELWHKKRVFFVTPQVLQSDMDNNNYPYAAVKLIVVDEAHRAKGRYAYVEVIQMLLQYTKYFRVLALTATPGRTVGDVAEVCRNLLISHIEVRSDTSIDVAPYVHKRRIETVVVKLSEQILNAREHLLKIIDPYIRQLIDTNVLSGSLANLNRNLLLYEQKHFREHCLRYNERHPNYTAINSNFSICISLYHALELLEHYGIRVFLNNFLEDEDGKQKFVLHMDPQLKNLIQQLKLEVGPNPFNVNVNVMTNGQIAEVPKDLDFGHPKFEKARECLKQHFMTSADSRAIVFCEFRESVMLIYRMLLQEKPLLRPRCFVGQGSGNSSSMRPLTQKQQLQIMNDFRNGVSNILIATSIGEEGIDVGEVELIVCFDINTSNPTRFIQRIGRTGRKKNGHVIMLVSEGREQQLLKDVLANKDQINKKILRSNIIKQAMYPNSPRLVPTEYQPECMHMYIKSDQKDEEDKTEKAGKRIKSKSKSNHCKKSVKNVYKTQKLKANTNQEDLRKFFTTHDISQSNNNDGKGVTDFDMENDNPVIESERYDDNISKMKTEKNRYNFKESLNESDIRQNKEVNDYSFNDHKQLTISNKYETQTTTAVVASTLTMLENVDAAHMRRVNKFLQTTLTTRNVLARSEGNDLLYHLKSKEMSNRMKLTLLKLYPNFIKENLEKMQILQILNEQNDGKEQINEITPEEKSIRLVNKIILELFGGYTEIQNFIFEYELNEMKNQIDEFEITTAISNNYSTCNTKYYDVEESYFQLLDDVFQEFDQLGPNVDNYNDIMEEFRKTDRYKDFVQEQEQEEKKQNTWHEQSVTYDLVENTWNDDTNFIEQTIHESKYFDQWPTEYKQQFVKNNMNNNPIQNLILNQTDIIEKEEQGGEAKNSHLTDNDAFYETYINSSNVGNITLHKECEERFATSRKTPTGIKNSLQNCFNDSFKNTHSISVQHDLAEDDDLFVNIFPEEQIFLQKLQQKQNRIEVTSAKSQLLQEQTSTPIECKHSLCNTFKGNNEKYNLDFNIFANECSQYKTSNQYHNTKAVVKEVETKKKDESDEKILPLIELQMKSPRVRSVNSPKNSPGRQIPTTPKRNCSMDKIDKKIYGEKSPSVFDMFLKSTHDKRKLPKISSGIIAANNSSKEKSNINFETTALLAHTNSSPQIRKQRYKNNQAKQLIFDSNSPNDENQVQPQLSNQCKNKKVVVEVVETQKKDESDNKILPLIELQMKSPGAKNMNSPKNSPGRQIPTTPKRNCSMDKIDKKIYGEKSPSVFDMFLISTHGKGKLPKISSRIIAVNNTSKEKSNINFETTLTAHAKCSPQIRKSRYKYNQAKRLIFDSSDSNEENQVQLQRTKQSLQLLEKVEEEKNDNETNIEEEETEEISATQMVFTKNKKLRRRKKHLRKRRILNAFIQTEACVSNDENESTDDESSYKYDKYDSIIVSSNDESEDEKDLHNNQLSKTNMHAIYLQSIKSPQQRRGAFKIPEPRHYNDSSHVFSQPVIATDDIQSQYVMDSFIVDDTLVAVEKHQNDANATLSPLEKAEMILKERRKAKRKCSKIVKGGKLRRKRIKQIVDDSCNEETSDEAS